MFEEYNNQKIAILGFGVEGLETFKYLNSKGLKTSIIDKKVKKEIVKENSTIDFTDIEFYTGDDYLSYVKGFDVVFKTPGIKNTSEIVDFIKNGKVLTSQINEFFKYCPCQIIGVTGTKGKGTTSTLIHQMLRKNGFDSYLGGNIGIPALSFLDKLNNDSKVVLELSSFQLQNLEVSPNISVVLNITQEHLDYHQDVNEYREAKVNIVSHQNEGDKAVINADYEVPLSFAKLTKAEIFYVSKEKETNGCYVDENDDIILRDQDKTLTVTNASKLLLRGRHNLENVTAATMAAFLAGCETESIKEVLESFVGLEHRLELVRELEGVRYYNDSFSTVPETAIAAIKAFKEPKIIILGGSYKGSDYKELGEVISKENVKAVILIGEMAEEIEKNITHDFVGLKILGLTRMTDIVAKARELASKGDVVLLSPACASFGLFKSYKDRGNQFKHSVNKLLDN